VFASPVVDGNLVFIGSCAGAFYALDKNSGAVTWKYDITQDGDQTSFHGNPLLVEDLIITGTDGRSIGHVYAFEKNTGKVRWKIPFTKGVPNGFGVPTDLLQEGAHVYGVAFGDELQCFKIKTGEKVWSFPSEFSRQSFEWSHSPAVTAQRVFFGGLDGFVYALESVSGKLIWKRDLNAKIVTAITKRADEIVLGTSDNKLYRLAQNSGEVLAEFSTATTPWWSFTATPDALLIFTNNGRAADVLHCFDRGLKKILWQQKAASEWTTARPFVWNDIVVTGNGAGEVYAFRLHDGALQWTHQLSGAIRSFGWSNDLLVAGTIEGKVFALEMKNSK
jgi:outer membrane protein assembly factor BamB